jgi:3-hydroxybutyryl-CoA dehydrogenase
MGHSIGQEFALAGFEVSLFDQSDIVRAQVKKRIEDNLNEMAEWGLIKQAEIAPALKRITVFSDLPEAVLQADLVIEAIFEILEAKQDLFRKLDEFCPDHTILASNTSSLLPSMIGEATNRPDKVLVLHYFYPPHLMPLVEIVKSPMSSEENIEAVYNAVIRAGKKPIIIRKETLGFVANRLQMALMREAIFMIEKGIASAQDIDIAVKYGFGRRLAHVGPIELGEVQDGWFQMSQIEKYIFPDLNNNSSPSSIIMEKVKKNEIGPQSGKGFYEWVEGSVESFQKKLYEQLANYIRADRKDSANYS